MTGLWNDFNDANDNLIPKGSLAKMVLSIRPGGFDDPAQGWTGGWAKQGRTGSVYLDVEYTVLEGPYAKRKIWSMIGLYSPKGPDWANSGRNFVRKLLNSARGIGDSDQSPAAQQARKISSFDELQGLVFAARIDFSTDVNGDDKNDIRTVITPGHQDYTSIMGVTSGVAHSGGFANQPAQGAVHQANPGAMAQSQQTPPSQAHGPAQGPGGRPTWAD